MNLIETYNGSGLYAQYASSADYASNGQPLSAALTAVPDTYLQNTDLTIVDNKITEISGVPLSAGDELPEGLMNTSALEYNAVNEISGYNGSAIAQYGAEKQWLTHDDTLVHLSNSAQYALGVNVPEVARQMGTDETTLFSGQATGNLTLSDDPLNYDRLLITFNASTGTTDMGAGSEIFEPDKTHIVCLHNYFMYQTSQTIFGNMNEAWAVYSGVDTTAWTRTIGGWRNGATYTSTLNNDNSFLKISKIIGIGKKN